MLHRVMFPAALIAAMCLSGCIDSSTLITVDKNGAGTIVSTIVMSKAMLDRMQALEQAMDDKKSAPARRNPLLDDVEKYKTAVASMGEGVAFVSAEEVSKPDGSRGVKVAYSFADIGKVRVSPGGQTADTVGKSKAAAKPESPVTFNFVKGSPARLTINMPKQDRKVPAGAAAAPAQKSEKETPPEMLEMMKQMFDGFRVKLAVKVDGEITKSNAAFMESEAAGKRRIVNLFEMDMGALLKDDGAFKKLSAISDQEDISAITGLMKEMPGVKIETAEQVNIEFK